MKQSGWGLVLKRAIDVGVAGVGLVLTAPIQAATAIAIRATMGSPVLFRQMRPGRNAEPFEILKFRTMTNAVDSDGRSLPDESRLTSLGQFVRSTSLDELPQLWNVLRGDISLVGPRPLLMRYLPRYSPEQARRHDVLPGITGWAQVNGRNALGWREKFALDVWYVEHWSPWLDARILALTAFKVLARDGISNGQSATMPEFMGSVMEDR